MLSRIIVVSTFFGLTLAGCTDYSRFQGLGFLKSAPTTEQLRIESAPEGAEARGPDGVACETPCELVAMSGSEFLVTLSKAGYQLLIVPVRPEGPGGQLQPNPVIAELQPVVLPSPGKRPPAKKKAPQPKTDQ